MVGSRFKINPMLYWFTFNRVDAGLIDVVGLIGDKSV